MVPDFNEMFSGRQLCQDVKVFRHFQELTDVISFGANKPSAHPEDIEGARSQKFRKSSHLDAFELLNFLVLPTI
jgi:hypothetical protein